MVRILEAQWINQLMGGAAVMPWEVDLISDEYRLAFDAMKNDVVEARKGYSELDQRFQQAKARFQQRH